MGPNFCSIPNVTGVVIRVPISPQTQYRESKSGSKFRTLGIQQRFLVNANSTTTLSPDFKVTLEFRVRRWNLDYEIVISSLLSRPLQMSKMPIVYNVYPILYGFIH